MTGVLAASAFSDWRRGLEMYRRRVMIAAAAVFTIGVAFAAQPISERAELHHADVQQRVPWVPGTNMLMSAPESSIAPLAPPQ
jgi:hypothetical protein